MLGPFKVKKLVGPEGQSVELELPSRWTVNNIFHTTQVEQYCSRGCGLRDEPIAVTDSCCVNRLGVTHEVGYDVDGNQVLEDFKVEEIMGSHYNVNGNKVFYFIKWKDYPEESE